MVFLLKAKKDDRYNTLVRKTLKGNQQSAEELYYALLPFVKSIIYKNIYQISEQETEELAHDIVVRVFEKLDHFDLKRNGVFPWAGRIAKNYIIDRHRRDRKGLSLDRNQEVFYALPQDGKTPELLAIQKENRERLRKILRNLPHQKLRLIMAYADGLSMKELADKSGRSVGAVTTEVFRIKRHIRGLFYQGVKVDERRKQPRP